MAGKTAAKGKASKAKAKEPEAPAEDLEEELEEVEGTDEESSGKSKASDEVTFGVADLAAHLTEKSGKKVTTRELRTLIRKMARDGSQRVNREIVPGNRTRYNWTGIKDPEVQAIIKAFNSGELEDDKKAKLAELKANKEKKKKAKKDAEEKAEKAGKSKGKKGKKAEDDDELELDDDE